MANIESALRLTLEMFTTEEYLRGLNRDEWECGFIQSNIPDSAVEFPFDNLRFEWSEHTQTLRLVGKKDGTVKDREVHSSIVLEQMVSHLEHAHGYSPVSPVCGLEPARHALLHAVVSLLHD